MSKTDYVLMNMENPVIAKSEFSAFPAVKLMVAVGYGFHWAVLSSGRPRYGLWHSPADAVEWLTKNHRGRYSVVSGEAGRSAR